MRIPNRTTEDGYIVLMSVITIGAIAIGATLTILLSGIGAVDNALAHQQSGQAKLLANACAEEGLELIRERAGTTSGSLALGVGSCTYAVTGATSVSVTGTVGAVVRKATVTVSTLYPQVTVTSWQDI